MVPAETLDRSALVETVALDKRKLNTPTCTPQRLRLRPLCGGPDSVIDRSGAIAGRQLGVEMSLPSPDVSRRHCRFDCYDGVWWVSDLGSLNGVFVNGRCVYAAELRAGDRLDIGAFAFIVGGAQERDQQRAILASILAELDSASAA
jgi:pSer/pThr/pTyr-binding forkhead associated (FHA) protein